ncbi:hypothetical protein ES703_114719 [subsurface metagenome]
MTSFKFCPEAAALAAARVTSPCPAAAVVQSSTSIVTLERAVLAISLAINAELNMVLNLDGSVRQRILSAFWLALRYASK